MSAVALNDVATILACEQDVLSRIEKYLLCNYEQKVELTKCAYDYEPDFGNREFWKYAIAAFEERLSETDISYKILFNPSHRMIRKNGEWVTSLDDLKKAFETVKNDYLFYSRGKKTCENIFLDLLKELELAFDEQLLDDPKILGRAHYNYIEQLLDIEDDMICKTLPFLLTAYVYNFRINRFMSRGSTSVEGAFNIKEIETTRISEMKKRLTYLSQLFGFAGQEVKFSDSQDSSSEKPAPFLPKQFPGPQNKAVLDFVFNVWCVILSGNDKKAQPHLACLKEPVDFQLSYALYIYYTDKTLYDKYRENGFPPVQEIFNSNIRLL